MTEPGEGDERIIDGELHWLRDGVWLKERERPRWRYFARCPHDCGWWAELGVDGARAAAMVHICRAKACPGRHICGRTHDECWAQARVLVEWEDAIFGADAASAIEQGLRAIAGWPMPLVAVNGGVMRLDDAAKLRTVLGEDGEVVVRPSARTACYFCGRAVADGVCTVCGERQP